GAEATPPMFAVEATASENSSTFAIFAYTSMMMMWTSRTSAPISRYSGAWVRAEKSEPEAICPITTNSISVATSAGPAVLRSGVTAMTRPSRETMRMVQVVALTTVPRSGGSEPTQLAAVGADSEPNTTMASEATVIGRSSSSKAPTWASRWEVSALVHRLKRGEEATAANIAISHTEYMIVSVIRA